MDIFEIFSSWFMLLCSLFGIICAILFTIIICLYQQYRSMTILLVFNSIIAGFIANTICFCQAIYQLMNIDDDILCPFRGFLLHVGTGFLYHTLCIQALHRLFIMVFLTRRYLRSSRVIISMVIIQWIISINFGLPILLTGRIVYQAGSRICQVSFYDRFGFLYLAMFIYMIPVTIIMHIYIHIVRYVKQHSSAAMVHQNIVNKKRQQRDMILIRRTVILVFVLLIMSSPYGAFFTLDLINKIPPPSYALRICYMFLAFGQGISMLLCLIESDDIKNLLIKIICIKRRTRVDTIAIINIQVQNNRRFKL